jgi:hypothetical protein
MMVDADETAFPQCAQDGNGPRPHSAVAIASRSAARFAPSSDMNPICLDERPYYVEKWVPPGRWASRICVTPALVRTNQGCEGGRGAGEESPG